ncbi:MAG: isoprenyl transferase [Ignavibacterium sp.]|nr:isoprenyl transferase [Ignavibacterium sp.]MDW8374937.1 isoprenyl transferase [Ignavibacteriales bacterium]
MAKSKSYNENNVVDELKKNGNIPTHIAIIMDGNGRWAKQRGLPRVAGHKRGVDTVKVIVEACAELGVKYLTLYTFSTENWNRPKDEVSTLMKLLLKSLKDRVDELCENDIRLTTIGDINALPELVQKQLLADIERTKNNKKMVLNLALSYSGRWEIIKGIKKLCEAVKNNKFNFEDLDEKSFSQFLDSSSIPDPDLVIRTSGEFRVSNFLLWQIAYSEFYITDVFWPDFNRNHLYEAIRAFQKRERRFGKVSEQVKKEKKQRQN